MNLRLSVSALDTLAYYEQSEDKTLAKVLQDLRGESPRTESMLAGTALHKFLENSGDAIVTEFEQDGYTFRFDCDDEISLAPVRELKGWKDYVVDGVNVRIVGKVDGIHGIRVDDHKFTSRWDAEKFTNSTQWRCYLDIFNARQFRYNVFVGRKNKDGIYVIREFHQLPLYRYPGMEQDVVRAIEHFVGFAREHLPEKFTEEQAA